MKTLTQATRRRTGLLAIKLGMTTVYNEAGARIPVTVLHVPESRVVAQRTPEKHRYTAVQLTTGHKNPSRLTKPLREHYAKAGVEPGEHVGEFRVSPEAVLDVGTKLACTHFIKGQFIDVCATSIGKGFAGVMKRHNFRGLEASHGVSLTHRSHGSTGQRQDPGRVFKGKKMAGHMGSRRVTTLNLSVVAIDPEHELLLVSGAVPGHEGTLVRITDAIKRPIPAAAPFPALLANDEVKPAAEETKPESDQVENMQSEAAPEAGQTADKPAAE
jgi:large subunit ribosomal protein L3